jgi:hypothetical protein
MREARDEHRRRTRRCTSWMNTVVPAAIELITARK